ncbi:type VII secretion protein EccE [Plantactinospora sp. GCM10030261]|uniref:type VII secretion protein EccE n=1 Tax=Plantactinospora sp. GCM10030261 TaxID=3273420 RepID=UPI00360AF625
MTAELARARTVLASRTARVVATQVALALLLAATGSGPRLAVAVPLAALLCAGWLRLRGRWLTDWVGVVARRYVRDRTIGPDAGGSRFLALVAPRTGVVPMDLSGTVTGVLTGTTALTMVLELGDPARVLGDPPRPLPRPADLLPASPANAPTVLLRLLVTTVAAPAPDVTGPAGTGYRELTGGRRPSRDRALLAVRVLRSDRWSEPELRQALGAAARRIRRRLAPLPVTPLTDREVLAAVADLAGYEPGGPVAERWAALRIGDQLQVTYRVDGSAALPLDRLLMLPAAAVTVAVDTAPGRASDGPVLVRLAAPLLSDGVAALHRLVGEAGGTAQRLDGEHLPALAATLPLTSELSSPGLDSGGNARVSMPRVGDAGLVLGVDRHGAPVTARLFRPGPTEVLLVGGLGPARLWTMRARALGARIVVRTARPAAWAALVAAIDPTGAAVTMRAPGRPIDAVGTPVRPLFVVVDAGPVPVKTRPAPGPRPVPDPPAMTVDADSTGGWTATLIVRDGLSVDDRTRLGRVDLVALGRLGADEAALVGATLGTTTAGDWLTRIRDDMVALVEHGTLRWAVLAATATESHLVNPAGPVPPSAADDGRPGVDRHGTMPGWEFSSG